jgi:hypothetical protein
MSTPLVIWWTWVAIIVLSLLDLVIQGHGHNFITLRIVFGALAITGAIYALTLWPVVIADNAGVRVRNPVRTFYVPWGAVHGIYLADSVEVQCARPAPKKDKTVYSWALSSPRRTRARAQLRSWQWDQGKRAKPSGYTRMPEQAQSLVKMTTAEIMARELAAMSEEARFRSVMKGVEISVDPGDDSAGDGDHDRKASSAPGPTADDRTARDTAARDTAARDTARARDAAASEAKTASGGASGGAAPAKSQDAETSGSQTAEDREIDPDAPEPTAAAGSPEYVRGTWSWPSLAAVLAPTIAFIVTLIVK